VWTFEPVQAGCRTRLVVEFELSIPFLGPLLANLVLLLMRKNVERMLDALRRRAEEGSLPGPEAEEDRSWR
jgi:ribosome-associated toxin RatA of RatAB toxin-antitoxin module